MRRALTIVVLVLGYLSTPWLGSDGATLADEFYPDATLGSNTKPSSSTNLIKQAKDLLSNTRAGKLVDLGTVTVQFVVQGSKWSNTNISASFMPDGTLFDGEASGLFNLLDQRADRAVWQRQYARALARWAAVTPLNFRFVPDNGAAHNAVGKTQADPNFGDLRCGAKTNGNYMGQCHYPSAISTGGGDSLLNTQLSNDRSYNVGTHVDIYSIMLHEMGHALGLGESSVYPVVMYPAYFGPNLVGLYPDDIAGAQAIYGPRLPDAYDAASANDTPEYASPVAIAATGQTFFDADLTTIADVDYYRVTVPAGAGPFISVTAESGRSLLQPCLTILDAEGSVLGESSAAGYGQGTLLQVSTVGTELIIGVDSPVEDEFGSGAYRLAVEFRTSQDEIPYVPPTMQNPDAKEVNDSLAVATDLGQTSSKTTTGLNIHWAWDEDFFKFKTAKTTVKNYEVSVAYTSGTAPLAIEIFNAAGTKIAQSNGTNYVRFAVVKNTSYSVRVYCPTRLLRGYNVTVKKYN